MQQNWENKFSTWAQPPGKTETERCENTEAMVRKAIQASSKLKARDVKVFSQGSYRNRTNVPGESDVDIGVVCFDTFFPNYPSGTTRETFGNSPASYHYAQFKDEVGEALVSYFGAGAVSRGNKAFDVRETTYHVEADVAPFFEHRRYATDGTYISGVEMQPDKGPRIINWPEQQYANGVAKNDRTGRSYKALIRIIKNLRNEMNDAKAPQAAPIVGFLNECLLWNVPDATFQQSTYWAAVRGALVSLFGNTQTDATCSEWGEVSELKYLFRPSQKWTRQQANDFVVAAWNYLGMT
ncbi:MAG: nucleotidyltransferase [Bauldia sp.]